MYLPAPDESTWVGVMRLVLEVPASRSLKDKRRVLSRVRDRLRARSELCVAEVGHLEDRSRSVFSVVTVSNDARVARATLDRVAGELPGWSEAHLLDVDIEVLRTGGSFSDHS